MSAAGHVILIGEHPCARDANGKLKSRIATAFPRHDTLVTLPGIHVAQRQSFLEALGERRRREGREPLSRQEKEVEWNSAVDLIIEGNTIQIRPDPGNMTLAFRADEMLQGLVAKQRISFLGVLNHTVRDAIKERGELWRITPLPKSPEEMRAMIEASRCGIGGREIYYYSATTGTRYLTFQQLEELGLLEDEALRSHLEEIRTFLGRTNAGGYPELSLFPAGVRVSRPELAQVDFTVLRSSELRRAFESLQEKIGAAVRPELRRDDPENVEWRNAMIAALIGREDEMITEETLLGLSPEFFMQIEWLPGGRIEEGEIIFDTALEETGSVEEMPPGVAAGPAELPGATPPGKGRQRDEKPRLFLFNFVREYDDLEYVNVGRVIGSLSRRPALHGRRGVYVALLKQRQGPAEIVTMIRLQKQGVREYLDEGNGLLDAMIRSEEYTEYVLDRRLACRQLGMNLPQRTTAKRISERYIPREGGSFPIWTPYFEREYIRGIATDKLPPSRFESEEFAMGCARLLGEAAAPNMVVGRCDTTGIPLFDDGDEVLIVDNRGMPADIVVADHTGTFNDCASPLAEFTSKYALPVNRRVGLLAAPARFATAYLESFEKRLLRLQEDYRRRRRAFDTLFAHLPAQEVGSFAYRWRRVLRRLDEADPRELASLIRGNVKT